MTLDQFTYWLEGYLVSAAVPFEVKKAIEAKLAECRERTDKLTSGLKFPVGARGLAQGGRVPDGVTRNSQLDTIFGPGDGDQREALARRG